MQARSQYVRLRPYPEHKLRKLEEYVELLSKYANMLVVGITGIPAPTLHEIRHKLRERGELVKVVKNRLFIKALEKVAKDWPDYERIKEIFKGQNAVIFTNRNPFSLVIFLKKEYKMTRQARPGDIATNDIVVPAGNTGFAPGPIISLFNKLKIPIRIQEGSIWVTSDTVVARKGDEISPELADLLGKLGLKPIEVTLPVKAIIVEGRLIEPEEVIDPDEYKDMIADAHSKAINLAVNACIPVPETIEILLAKAYVEAQALAVATALPVPETIDRVIARASCEAAALYELVKSKAPDFD